ncbi:MAG: CaiB/BaiF CoA transferase family protein [bacterium]|jgi:CoA:oxalate CoA-transferase
MALALEGLKVLDLTRVASGPFTTQMLADFGADVIKIEMPRVGDDSRAFGPFFENGESTYFLATNRNKKSITMNLKHPKAVEMFKEMVKQADVVVENYAPGVMDRLGLGYDVLKEINPRIIYCCVSGFGHSGPYSARVAYDVVAQAMGGLLAVTGTEETPTRTGPALGDLIPGLFGAFGILAAVVAREKTGKGQKVDVAMQECISAMLENRVLAYFLTGEVPKRIGNRHPVAAPYNTYKAKDGYVVIGVANEALWGRLCKAMGREELINDPKFNSSANRVANVDEVDQIVQEFVKDFATDDLVKFLEENAVPCAPVYTIDKLVVDPHWLERGMLTEADHPTCGKHKLVNAVPKLSDTPGNVRFGAPLLGQHNEEIYGKLFGLTSEDIEKLKEEKAI